MTLEPKEEPKVKHPRAVALAVVREFLPVLKPETERIIIAGSLRRKRAEVGDIEILFIPKVRKFVDRDDLFCREVEKDAAGVLLECLVEAGYLAKRPKRNGTLTWGPENKLAVHVGSGIPIDFFATDARRWWNALVCRTGGAETNKAIAAAAIERGWHWNVYGEGFSRGGKGTGREEEVREMRSEEEVFAFVGMECLPPEGRR